MELGNVRGDSPIHGFLAAGEVGGRRGEGRRRLRVGDQPPGLLQAAGLDGAVSLRTHDQITYRLKDGALNVAVESRNLSAEPMPVAIGFHPYFRVDDAPREAWTHRRRREDRMAALGGEDPDR